MARDREKEGPRSCRERERPDMAAAPAPGPRDPSFGDLGNGPAVEPSFEPVGKGSNVLVALGGVLPKALEADGGKVAVDVRIQRPQVDGDLLLDLAYRLGKRPTKEGG